MIIEMGQNVLNSVRCTLSVTASVLKEDLLGELLITKNTVNKALPPNILTKQVIPDP